MDIIVTTPKSQMRAAAREAADCLAAGGGEYFRRFPMTCYPVSSRPGDRVYYVEDGFVRGFAVLDRRLLKSDLVRCDTTGRDWAPGVYLFMRADSWRWVCPIPMRGFQGFRYIQATRLRDSGQVEEALFADGWRKVEILGDWRQPRPTEAIAR